MYRTYKKRLDRLRQCVDHLPPTRSAEDSAAGEEMYDELCELFLTKYNMNVRIAKEVRERSRPTVRDDQYFIKLAKVLEPFPEAKELVYNHLIKSLERREAVKATESPAY